MLDLLLQPSYQPNSVIVSGQFSTHFLHFDLVTRDDYLLPLQFLLHSFDFGHVDGANISDFLAQHLLVIQLRALGDLLALEILLAFSESGFEFFIFLGELSHIVH